MKTNRRLKALQIGISIILIFHLITVLLVIRAANSALNQSKIGPVDLIGVEKLYYVVNLGVIDKTFEYVYDQGNNEPTERHLYTTKVAHLEPNDKNKVNFDLVIVPNKKSSVAIDVPITRLPLIVPVNISQKNKFIYSASIRSILFIMYSFLIFYQLKRFIKSLVNGNPFTRNNIRLLFSIGILVIAFPVLQYIVESLELSWIKNQFSYKGYSIYSDISFQYYLFGLGILILTITEVLRQSISIKKEHELTI